MPDKITFTFFLSSPGDVAAERKLVHEVLDDLNADPFISDQARVEVLAWEDPASRVLMPVSLTPQEAIDRELAKPSETDAVIVIFWGRMGTPLDVERHGTKANGDPYWSGTEWEFLDAIHGASAHPDGLPIVYVYRRIDTPPPPDINDLKAMREYVTQRERVDAFYEQFRDPASGAYRGMVHEYETPDAFRERFAQDARLMVQKLPKLRRRAESRAETTPPASEDIVIRIHWTGSPFPGLRAFTERDEPIFFGRAHESTDLLKRLSSQRVMFVVGASGSGKSSLVGAGLIPQLKRGALYGVAGWHVAHFTPGDAPFERLAQALLRTLPALADGDDRAETLAGGLREAPDQLAQQVEKWLSDAPAGTELLLFIDQFEELYTTAPESERAAFAAMLNHPSPQIRVVATIRSDFYDRALHDFEAVLRDGNYTLSTPSPLALHEMIVRPAQVTGLEFDEGLPELIVEKTIGQSGGLALVAYLLEALYLQAASHGDGKLTQADYDALGGVEKAIATRAATVYRSLDLPDERKRAALERVFHELVEPTVREGQVTATRRRAPQALFADDEDARQLIDVFTTARLLVQDQGHVEVAHEALLREWDELAQWIALIGDDLRLLRQIQREAHEWDRTYVQPAERLKPIHEAVKRLEQHGVKIRLGPVVRDYIYPQAMLLEELKRLPIDDPRSHLRRQRIGDDLALLGDPRQGVGVKDGVPDIAWLPVEVPKSVRGKPIGFKDHKGRVYGEFRLKPFYIAQYLVTYPQFEAFCDADDGFRNPEWWNDFPRDYQRQELAAQRTPASNNPRDSVSWYQSVAFSRWLNHRLSGVALGTRNGASALVIGKNAEVRLPTEWEWQWAAQNGLEERAFPWGEWEAGRSNTTEAGLGRAVAVGMYPQGAAVCGALDMAGNLYEWCLNDHGNPEIINGYTNGKSKVLRGRAFVIVRNFAACAYRGGNYPPSGNFDYGLRLVVVPLSRL